MHERFSDRARHAMALANLEAGRLNHDYLAPAHVMLGLIAEGKCVATEAMRLLDVDLDRIRDDVRARLGMGTASETVGRRAQTKETNKTIETAIQEARGFGHKYVGTEHLLLALLQQTESVPAKVLAEHGIQLDALREKVLAVLRASLDPAHDLTHSRHGEYEWVHQQELAKAFRSPKFWHTMILAVDIANRHGAGEIHPLHLLAALLRDPGNGITELMRDKGVTLDWVEQRIAARANGAA